MKKWIAQYHQEQAAETEAKRRAAAENIGHYYTVGGVEYIAWPNGETSEAAEYETWLNRQAINAQYGYHG